MREAEAELARLRHVLELSGGRVPSRQEIDSQEATVKRAQADHASSGAQIMQSQASLTAIETDIKKAVITAASQAMGADNLRTIEYSGNGYDFVLGQAYSPSSPWPRFVNPVYKAVIRSPINGIVLDRQVDPGQTVAASFQTPTLFTVAEDLTKMRLIVDVDEADIGNVRVGQTAVFRVDAYPDRTFASKVTEVRSTPKTSNGVVTYQTVLSVDNSDTLLQPGMTATAEITVTQVTDAVLVPNAALRFTPPQTQAAPGGGGFRFLPRPPGLQRRDRSGDGQPRVWRLVGDQVEPIDVTLGPTDGRVTVLRGGDLEPGTEVIVDLAPTS